MENLANASSYYQHLKSLVDQLSKVDALVSNDRLFLQLITDLTYAYTNIG